MSFCGECTFYNQYNLGRDVQLDQPRVCVNDLLSKCDFESENTIIGLLAVKDELPLMVTEGNCDNVEWKIVFVQIGVLQLIFLENFYAQEAKDEDKGAVTINMNEFGKVNWLILFTTRSGLKKL